MIINLHLHIPGLQRSPHCRPASHTRKRVSAGSSDAGGQGVSRKGKVFPFSLCSSPVLHGAHFPQITLVLKPPLCPHLGHRTTSVWSTQQFFSIWLKTLIAPLRSLSRAHVFTSAGRVCSVCPSSIWLYLDVRTLC